MLGAFLRVSLTCNIEHPNAVLSGVFVPVATYFMMMFFTPTPSWMMCHGSDYFAIQAKLPDFGNVTFHTRLHGLFHVMQNCFIWSFIF